MLLVFGVVGVSSVGILSDSGSNTDTEEPSPSATEIRESHPLAYCVEAYEVEQDDFQTSALLVEARDLIEDAIRAIVSNPEWERAHLGDRESYYIDIGCPGEPAPTGDAAGWPEGKPVAGRFWPIHETNDPSPYRQFVFVTPGDAIERLFGSTAIRSAAQEIQCAEAYCYPSAHATYLTPDEIKRGSPRTVSMLEASLGLSAERAAERRDYCVDTYNLSLNSAGEASLISDAVAALEEALIRAQELPLAKRAEMSPIVPAVDPRCPTEPVLAQMSADDWVEGVYWGPPAPRIDEESKSPYRVHLYIVSSSELARRVVGSNQRRFTQEASCSGHVCFPLTGSIYLTPAEIRDQELVVYHIEVTEGLRFE